MTPAYRLTAPRERPDPLSVMRAVLDLIEFGQTPIDAETIHRRLSMTYTPLTRAHVDRAIATLVTAGLVEACCASCKGTGRIADQRARGTYGACSECASEERRSA